MASKDPIILGRFNYLSYKTDSFNVLFVPFVGTHATIIARNLPKEDALALIEALNGGIDDARQDLKESYYDEEEVEM